jgi:hypothetical protein
LAYSLPKFHFSPATSRTHRTFITSLAVLLLSSISWSQQGFLENGNPHPPGVDSGIFAESPTRTTLDLSGQWTYLRENGEAGVVRVPHAYDFDGRVTFERRFSLTSQQLDASQFHLVMFGASHSAEISINGDFAVAHNNGYTSFVQPIQANLLQVGDENLIRVSVSNHLDGRKTFPLRPAVWEARNYGGIQRDIFLLATPLVYVKNVVVSTEVDDGGGRASVKLQVLVEGPDPSVGNVKGIPPGKLTCVVELSDKISGQLVQTSAPVPLVRVADGWEPADAQLTVDAPKLWSPETPDLYVAKCTILDEIDDLSKVVDEYDLNLGICSLDVHNGDFSLNGKRFVIKGVVWYEDHPAWGNALTYEQMERDVVLMKNLGANAIRFALHPPHPYMLNLCDRYGLMALVELPLHAPGKILSEDTYYDLVSAALKEMVVRDRNHPSVLAWGLGDGFDVESDASHRFVESLVQQARGLDDRPLYYGVSFSQPDRCSDLVDFVAVSATSGDLKTFKANVDSWRSQHGDRPLVVLGLGTEVQNANKNGYSDPLSQQAQARFYLQRLDLLRSMDFDGAFVRAFNDWRGDRPALTVHAGDPYLHSMGLVSGEREKRIAFDAVRSVFQNEKFVALPAGSSTATAPIIYVLSGFVLLVGLAYLYNAGRRFRESLNRSLLNSYNFFADIRDQHVVTGLHTTLLGLIVSGSAAVVISSILLHFRESLFLDNVLSLVLVADWIKVLAIRLIWNPLQFVLLGGMLMFTGMLLVTLIVMVIRTLVKSRVFSYHAYTVVVWSAAPLIVLIPVGMILYRIMESSLYVEPAFILYGILHLWVFLRFLKGLSIVFDARPFKVYLIGLMVAVVILAGLFLYYDLAALAPTYLAFWYQTLMSNG